MSSFIKHTPDWKKWACVDDHFGHQKYGYSLMDPEDTWFTFKTETAKFLTEEEFYDIYFPKWVSKQRTKGSNYPPRKIEIVHKVKKLSQIDRKKLIRMISKFLIDNKDLRIWQWLSVINVIIQNAPWSWASIKGEYNITDAVLYKRVKAAIAIINKLP